jgi:hypothetical protein
MDEKIMGGLRSAVHDENWLNRLQMTPDTEDATEMVVAVLTKLAELTPSLRTQEEVRRILGITE